MRTRPVIAVLSLALSVPLCGCIFEDNDRDHDRDHCDHDRDHCDH